MPATSTTIAAPVLSNGTKMRLRAITNSASLANVSVTSLTQTAGKISFTGDSLFHVEMRWLGYVVLQLQKGGVAQELWLARRTDTLFGSGRGWVGGRGGQIDETLSHWNRPFFRGGSPVNSVALVCLFEKDWNWKRDLIRIGLIVCDEGGWDCEFEFETSCRVTQGVFAFLVEITHVLSLWRNPQLEYWAFLWVCLQPLSKIRHSWFHVHSISFRCYNFVCTPSARLSSSLFWPYLHSLYVIRILNSFALSFHDALLSRIPFQHKMPLFPLLHLHHQFTIRTPVPS